MPCVMCEWHFHTRCKMTIDIHSETLLSMAQAARKFLPYRRDRPVNPSTIWRWIHDGVTLPDGSAVRLEGIRCGDRWLTSQEAIGRFIDAQTPNLDAPRVPSTPSANARKRAADRAAKALQEMGILLISRTRNPPESTGGSHH